MKRKAIALIRVSTEAQAEEGRGGLEAQRREILRLARTHDLALVEWVELEGVSGAAVMADPRFSGLLARLRDPDLHGVVVAAFDRLMRPERYADFGILDAFRETGTILYTPEGPRDLEQDGLISIMQGAIARDERHRIRERTLRAKEVLRQTGRHVSGPASLPYAATYRNEREGGAIKPVWGWSEPEASAVREVYRQFLGGEANLSAICRAVGIERTAIRRILTNPIYAGRRRITTRKHRGRDVPREDVIEFEVPALIAPEDFERAQALLVHRPARRRHTDTPCIYHGLTRCAACGARVHVALNRWGWQYRCATSTRVGVSCPTGQIAQKVIDPAVDSALVLRLGEPESLERLLAAALEALLEPQAETPSPAAAIAAIREERERGRVVTAFERGWRDEAETKGRLRDLDARLATLAALSEPAPPEIDPAQVAADLAEVFAGWETLQADSRGVGVRANERLRFIRKHLPGERADWKIRHSGDRANP